MPDAGRTREPCVQKEMHFCARKQHRFSRTTGIPRAMVLTATPRSPRCSGLVSHRHLFDYLERLIPSVGGTGPHGLTVREGSSSSCTRASIASRLTSGDDWPSRPSCRGGTVADIIWFLILRKRCSLRQINATGRLRQPREAVQLRCRDLLTRQLTSVDEVLETVFPKLSV
jgi:hypothetical protein